MTIAGYMSKQIISCNGTHMLRIFQKPKLLTSKIWTLSLPKQSRMRKERNRYLRNAGVSYRLHFVCVILVSFSLVFADVVKVHICITPSHFPSYIFITIFNFFLNTLLPYFASPVLVHCPKGALTAPVAVLLAPTSVVPCYFPSLLQNTISLLPPSLLYIPPSHLSCRIKD